MKVRNLSSVFFLLFSGLVMAQKPAVAPAPLEPQVLWEFDAGG
jgi:hypothetical protein